jgi:hypothetical protein
MLPLLAFEKLPTTALSPSFAPPGVIGLLLDRVKVPAMVVVTVKVTGRFCCSVKLGSGHQRNRDPTRETHREGTESFGRFAVKY